MRRHFLIALAFVAALGLAVGTSACLIKAGPSHGRSSHPVKHKKHKKHKKDRGLHKGHNKKHKKAKKHKAKKKHKKHKKHK